MKIFVLAILIAVTGCSNDEVENRRSVAPEDVSVSDPQQGPDIPGRQEGGAVQSDGSVQPGSPSQPGATDGDSGSTEEGGVVVQSAELGFTGSFQVSGLKKCTLSDGEELAIEQIPDYCCAAKSVASMDASCHMFLKLSRARKTLQ